LKIECQLAPRLEPLLLDPDQLQQVVLNLAVNAVQAADGGGLTRLSTGRAEGKPGGVRVVVEDNGRGIAKKHLTEIFEPFFTTRGQKGGTGLGLAISREIVEGFGGEILAQSDGEGRGAKFTIELPSTS